MKKRAAIAIAAVIVLAAAAAGCFFLLGDGAELREDAAEDTVELVYYTIGDPD